MSFLVHDLRCPQGHYEVNVTYRRSEGPTPCPECNQARGIFYATREMANEAQRDFTVGGEFRRFRYNGEWMESPEQFRRAKEHLCKVSGAKMDELVEVPVGSARERKARADELRHEAWVVRKREGFDDYTLSRYRAEQAARKQQRIVSRPYAARR